MITPIQKQLYRKGRNIIATGIQTLICANGPFPRGTAKADAERLCNAFLNDLRKLAEKTA